MELVRYSAEHLDALPLQAAQEHGELFTGDPSYRKALENGPAYTLEVDGVPVGSAGLYPMSAWRAYAWAMFGPVPRAAWLKITWRCRQEIARAFIAGIHRIETDVYLPEPPETFIAGHRFVRLLGFKPECIKRGFGPKGETYVGYARVLL